MWSRNSWEIQVPSAFSDHPFIKQIQGTMNELVLHDIEVMFSKSDVSINYSGFLLCTLSPVLRRMICGGFKEGTNKRLVLEHVDHLQFSLLILLSCGMTKITVKTLDEALDIAALASQYDFTLAQDFLENFLVDKLNISNCAHFLAASTRGGLMKLQAESKKMSLQRFEEMAASDFFLQLNAEELQDLLQDDELHADSEERVFEAVLFWLSDRPPDEAAIQILSSVRFALMDPQYLSSCHVLCTAPVRECARALASQAQRILTGHTDSHPSAMAFCLPISAAVPRAAAQTRWLDGGIRLPAADRGGGIRCLAEMGGLVFCGSLDGSIRCWDPSTLAPRLFASTSNGAVGCLCAWRGMLVSGHTDGLLRLWDPEAGGEHLAFQAHFRGVSALTRCGGQGESAGDRSLLASASLDGSVRLWRVGGGGGGGGGEDGVPQEVVALLGHTGVVTSLACGRADSPPGAGARRGRRHKLLVSGSADGTARVWWAATGTARAVLRHPRRVSAVAIGGEREGGGREEGLWLFTACDDGLVRVYSLKSLLLLRTLVAFEPAPDAGAGGRRGALHAACGIAAHGGWLFCASCRFGPEEEGPSAGGRGEARWAGRLRGWSLETARMPRVANLALEGAGGPVLVRGQGEVWAAVGRGLLAWGRRQP